MSYNPRIHHRQSIRLKNYNYCRPGSYFITICTENRICFFGHINDKKMRLNPAGSTVARIWYELPRQFSSISIDSFILMPNHLHGLINIKHKNETPLSQVIQYYKSISTSQYSMGVKELNWKPYPGKLWQRNYYESIVRNENHLCNIRRYIERNPQKWEMDKNRVP